MVMSAIEIAQVAVNAGFKGKNTVQLATAIALAESSGNATVINSIGATGLWQINQPVHVKAHPTWTKQWLQNPNNNAKAAYVLSNGGKNWTPWEAYTRLMHIKFMLLAANAATQVGETSTNDSSSPFLDATEGKTEGISNFLNALGSKNFWIRVLYYVVGIAMLAVGISKLTRIDNAIANVVLGVTKTAAVKKVL